MIHRQKKIATPIYIPIDKAQPIRQDAPNVIGRDDMKRTTATSIEKAKKRRARLLAEYEKKHKAANGAPGVKSAMARKYRRSPGRIWQLINQAIKDKEGK